MIDGVDPLEAQGEDVVSVRSVGGQGRREVPLFEPFAVTPDERGFDGVHLASALELRRLAGEQPAFWCDDDRLEAAARLEGLER